MENDSMEKLMEAVESLIKLRKPLTDAVIKIANAKIGLAKEVGNFELAKSIQASIDELNELEVIENE